MNLSSLPVRTFLALDDVDGASFADQEVPIWNAAQGKFLGGIISGGGGGGASTLDELTDVSIPSPARGQILYRDATQWVPLAPGTSGQFLRTGGAAADPSWATPAGGGGPVALDDLTDVAITAAAQGQILYRDGTQWVNLSPGTSGHFLRTGGAGANPSWAAVPAGGASTLDDLSDVAIVGAAQGQILYRSATQWTNLPPGTSGQFLKTLGAGANPAWDTIPAGGTSTLDSLTDVTISAPAQGQILYRNATEWVNLIPGTSGQFLRTNGAGANPSWATPPGGGGPLTLDDLTDVTLLDVEQGHVLFRGVSQWNNLPPGLSGDVLTSMGDGQDVVWATPISTLSGLQDVSLISPARGHLLYRGAAQWNNLAPGTSGQVLTTQGAGADPIWATGGGGASTLDGLSDVEVPTPSQGQLLYYLAGATNKWTGLNAGATAGHVLTSNGAGSVPSWQPAGGAGSLAGAVILDPAASIRNTIQPTGNFVPLTLKWQSSSHSASFLECQKDDGTPMLRVTRDGALRIGNFTTDVAGLLYYDGTYGQGLDSNSLVSFVPDAAGGFKWKKGGTLGGAVVMQLTTAGALSFIAGGSISVAGAGGSTTQQFGEGANASTHTSCTLVGTNATASGTSGTGLGNTVKARTRSVAIGHNAETGEDDTSTNNVIVGFQGRVRGVGNANSVGIGYNVQVGNSCVGIGANVDMGPTWPFSALGIMSGPTMLANNQAVFGSAGTPLSDVYFGAGPNSANASDASLNATGRSGDNQAGGHLNLKGGRSRGTGTGGSVVFYTAPPSETPGGALNEPVAHLTLNHYGNLGFRQTNFENGRGIIAIGNAFVVPTVPPPSGGYLYAEAGALKWRSAGGLITILAPNT